MHVYTFFSIPEATNLLNQTKKETKDDVLAVDFIFDTLIFFAFFCLALFYSTYIVTHLLVNKNCDCLHEKLSV